MTQEGETFPETSKIIAISDVFHGLIDDQEKIEMLSIVDTLDNLVKVIDEIKLRIKN